MEPWPLSAGPIALHAGPCSAPKLKGKARPGSDIDLPVELEPDAHPTLSDLAQIEIELSDALGGRKVDPRTPEDPSRFFRDQVVRTPEAQYAP